MKMEKQKWIYRLVIILLAFVLSVSIVFNYILYSQGRWYYLQLNSTRLYPLGLEAYPIASSQSKENAGAERRIVFLGDSRIAHWPQPAIDEYEIFNRGIGAQTSSQILQRYDYHVKPLEPDIVFVQVGINDLKTIPLFPERQEAIITDLQENILEITKKATDQNATVILTTIFPIGKVPIERKPFWSEDVELAIGKVNKFVSSLEDEKVVVFDTYSVLVGENEKILPEYSYDLLHLNEAGYEVLNHEFEQLMTDLSTR